MTDQMTNELEIVERLARIETRTESLPKLDAKVDQLLSYHTEQAIMLADHNARIRSLEEKHDRLHAWAIAAVTAGIGSIASAVGEFVILRH